MKFYCLREDLLPSTIWWSDNLFSVIAVVLTQHGAEPQGVTGQPGLMEFKAIGQKEPKKKKMNPFPPPYPLPPPFYILTIPLLLYSNVAVRCSCQALDEPCLLRCVSFVCLCVERHVR